jgi:hypothetical protein
MVGAGTQSGLQPRQSHPARGTWAGSRPCDPFEPCSLSPDRVVPALKVLLGKVSEGRRRAARVSIARFPGICMKRKLLPGLEGGVVGFP